MYVLYPFLVVKLTTRTILGGSSLTWLECLVWVYPRSVWFMASVLPVERKCILTYDECRRILDNRYMPAMSDVVIIVKNQGRIFLAGPPLVKAATGEIVDDETLGGGEMHTSVSGVADHLASSDGHAIRLAREAMYDLGNITPKALPPVRCTTK